MFGDSRGFGSTRAATERHSTAKTQRSGEGARRAAGEGTRRSPFTLSGLRQRLRVRFDSPAGWSANTGARVAFRSPRSRDRKVSLSCHHVTYPFALLKFARGIGRFRSPLHSLSLSSLTLSPYYHTMSSPVATAVAAGQHERGGTSDELVWIGGDAAKLSGTGSWPEWLANAKIE